jgi:phosphatidylinositol alpha-1,6-mannosyltransferase
LILVQHGYASNKGRAEYAQFDAIVTVGDSAESYRQLVPEVRVFRVDPGIDTERFSPTEKSQAKAALDASGREVLLFVGRLVHHKRVLWLLTVVGILAKIRPKILCLIVGGGPETERIRREIATRRLSSHVRLVPAMPNGALRGIYSAADVFVSCTSLECLPITIMEAMSVGVPVVAPWSAGIPFLVKEAENGWLITEGPDYEKFLRRTCELMLNDPCATAMRRRNRATAVQRFDVRAQGDALVEIYAQCLPNAR